ncbi:hypothetical protein NBO_18g0029 [Nosema bombycis CQ1]|uniref:Uncharacterized protein n=1 Tax=Nosema bombycis (strain CQ1 / CVCC 102059) TaxID=578461 RepID=R0KWU1_NOSB1|nr:hypothetical protein NBO_18g0029 [Nosema bombycis CQ1]|eukprot:EOB14702.1 hypothetical protein NBO_18g0029 [Nosema bombycis CQ1]
MRLFNLKIIIEIRQNYPHDLFNQTKSINNIKFKIFIKTNACNILLYFYAISFTFMQSP